jgi:multiple sugar transport system permease protein
MSGNKTTSAVVTPAIPAAVRLHWGRLAARTFYFILACLGALVMLVPLYWLIVTAFKDPGSVFTVPPILVPNPWLFTNFLDAMNSPALPDTFTVLGHALPPFCTYLWNTVVVTTLTVLGDTASGAFIAFGFARLRARGSNILFMLVLATIMLPYQAVLYPQFVLFKTLGWVNTWLPLIVPTYFGSAFNIFLLRQFFMGIPRELDEAATIDGCGYFRIFWNIILPLSKPALAAVAVFSFVYHWNDLLGPLVYLNTTNTYTVSLALQQFTGAYGLAQWNLLMAAALISALPCLILFFVAQRYFIQGIVVSGVKG